MRHCPIDPARFAERDASPRTIEVREYMTRPAITIGWEQLVANAWKIMTTRNIRHLPVVDADGVLVGILTETDIREALIGLTALGHTPTLAEIPSSLIVGKVMTWGADAVTPATEIAAAARFMRDRKLSALPVVEAERVVGILTEIDVMRGFLAVLDALKAPRNYQCGF